MHPDQPPRPLAASMAILVVAVVGCGLDANQSPSRVSGAASAAPSTSPTASADASAIAGVGTLESGTHGSAEFSPALTFEVPAGWMIVDDNDDYYVLGTGDGSIVVQTGPTVASNEQDCAGLAASGRPRTVDAIRDALASDPRFVTSTEPVTISRVEGRSIDIQLAADWTGTCEWSDGSPAALVLTAAQPPGPVFGIGGSERARVILLEIAGDVIAISIDPSDSSDVDDFLSQAMPVVESFEFDR
jgi:hypothetical protein